MMSRGKAGFTLVEIVIVMFIASLVYITIFRIYDHYRIVQRIETTKENLSSIDSQVSFFFSNTLRYPCPADRTLAPGDPGYGIEFEATCDAAAAGLGSPGDCTSGGGVCLAAGARDLDSSGTIGDIADELVLIGAVPLSSMLQVNDQTLPLESAIDGWGRKLTYAVTLSQTSNATYKFFNGQLDARDEFSQPTAGINGDAHYVLVSHGPDGKGAYLESGPVNAPCGPVSDAVDNENCNDDAVFAQALGHYEANTPNFFDDYVYFSKNQSTALWSYIPGTQHIINLNTGDVGVGTNTPQERLDVAGVISVDRNLRAQQVCDSATPSLCFPINAITGSGVISCPTGQVMVGISSSNEDCAVPAFASPQASVDCSPGWVRGIRTDGSIICSGP